MQAVLQELHAARAEINRLEVIVVHELEAVEDES